MSVADVLLSRPWLAALASGPDHEHASPQQQARHHRAQQKGQAEGLTDPCLVLVQGADDLQHPAHVTDLPILARRLIVCAVALDTGSLHDPRLSVADDAPPTHFGELMDRHPPLAPTQTPQRLAFELIPRAAVGSPGERVVAVLAHL